MKGKKVREIIRSTRAQLSTESISPYSKSHPSLSRREAFVSINFTPRPSRLGD
jgi:hypothetical protein